MPEARDTPNEEAPLDEAPKDEAPNDEAPNDEAPKDEAPSDAASTHDDLLETLWARALDAWDDDKRHAALLELALSTERLPDLAGKYRALEKDPEKGPRAKKRLDAIVTAATQMLLAMKTPAPPKSNKPLTFFTAIVCAAMLSYLLWMILHGGR